MINENCNHGEKEMENNEDFASDNEGSFRVLVNISPEMASFTNWDINKKYSRIDVTRFICEYIRNNNLQNPKDEMEILCDDNLRKIIKFENDGEVLTYLTLQSYIKHHFV